ncbi:hypothetical protein ACFFX0_10030 [Citricoccus parietis]|uniref:Uncharacterized protein n=1 Tax=Citricoccus parietis TaxID=592307 RepID=A0ABV5FXU9_9MICC
MRTSSTPPCSASSAADHRRQRNGAARWSPPRFVVITAWAPALLDGQDHSEQDGDDDHNEDDRPDLQLTSGEPLPLDVLGSVLDAFLFFRHVHPSLSRWPQ